MLRGCAAWILMPVILLLHYNAMSQTSPCTDGYISSVKKILKTTHNYENARNLLLQRKLDCNQETLGARSKKSLDSLIDIVEKKTGKIIRERIADRDGDGFADDIDKCPDEYSRYNGGCPVATSGIFSKEKIPQAVRAGDYTDSVHKGHVNFTSKDTTHYEGYIKNDLFNGWGTITFADGDTYTGEFKDGYFEGYGEYSYRDGSQYTGFWVGNQYNGIGKLKAKKGIVGCAGAYIYMGYFKDGMKSGYGHCYDNNMHLVHDGMFEYDGVVGEYPSKNPVPYTGNGGQIEVINIASGGRFMGFTKDGKEEGKGVFRQGTKREYNGEWENGAHEGFGSYRQDDLTYSGEWKKGIKTGWGSYDLGNGIEITGAFKNDELNGQGIMQCNGMGPDIPLCPGARFFSGNFVKSRKEGMGKCYDRSRKLIYEGMFVNDRPTGKFPMK